MISGLDSDELQFVTIESGEREFYEISNSFLYLPKYQMIISDFSRVNLKKWTTPIIHQKLWFVSALFILPSLGYQPTCN